MVTMMNESYIYEPPPVASPYSSFRQRLRREEKLMAVTIVDL